MEKRGLQSKEAKNKLQLYGYNELKEVNKLSPLKILLRQVRSNFIVYLLTIAMIISFFVEKHFTAYAILGVIVLVVAAGFIQEYRAERAIKSLKKLITPVSIVIRDSKEKEILSREIVPEDFIVLRSGEKIPADCILIDEKELYVDESILTGESAEIRKSACKNESDPKPENLIFAGTFIVNGKCIAKVIHTGMNTRFGKIAEMIFTEEKELPLQNKVNNVAKYMVFIAIISAILTGLVMIIRSESISSEFLIDVLIVMIAISVAAFPEGFPVALITTLSSGAYRMAKKNAIVNRMSIIETLGETTVICSDKTGTITKGEMTVKKIFSDNKLIEISGSGYEGKGEFLQDGRKINPLENNSLELLLKSAVICNDSKIERKGEDKDYNIRGTPTEASLLILASKANLYQEDLDSTRLEEIPFSSERKLMTVLSQIKNKKTIFTKGAPEILIQKCRFIQRNNGIFRLTRIQRKKILQINEEMTSSSFRTLALAYKPYDSKNHSKDSLEKDLIFLGIVSMEDPPRDELKDSITICKEAGIKVKMITGDHKETAISIAKQVGLTGKVITGEEIDRLTDSELSNLVNEITIFARVRPEHKLRIVSALKNNGEVVTMTGDGINDAPALKAAHIGVAMGKTGTDVSRDVSDLILKDDNFSTIVAAVSEGRTIFNNMRKFVTYQLSCNYAEIFIVLIGILLGLPLPLLAIQILFMNIVTDNLPAITLGLNSGSADSMKRNPRRSSELLNKELLSMLFIAGTIMGIGTLAVFYFTLEIMNQELSIARTTALVTLILFEIANAFNFRSFRKGALSRSPFVNKYLVIASFASLLATFAVIYTPLRSAFETSMISINSWLVALAVSLSIIIIFDILKQINNKKGFWKDLYA